MRRLWLSTLYVLAFTATLSLTACASLPPKQVATTDLQQVETLLGTVQDTATALCVPSPPTHCTATPVVFTDAAWHTLNVGLKAAFAAQVQLATALKAWTPSPSTLPPSVDDITGQAQAVVTALQALPTSAAETKLLAEAQAVLAEIHTVSTLITTAQANAGGASPAAGS